jgi:hypothetical protein
MPRCGMAAIGYRITSKERLSVPIYRIRTIPIEPLIRLIKSTAGQRLRKAEVKGCAARVIFHPGVHHRRGTSQGLALRHMGTWGRVT